MVRSEATREGIHWCFTVNNYTEEQMEILKNFAIDHCKYLTYGKEVGEKCGTPHLQGYLALLKKKKGNALKKMLFSSFSYRLKCKKSTVKQAVAYCHKDGIITEYGTMPQEQGEAGGEATKEKYWCAWDSAKKNNLDDIDPQILVTHYGNLKRIAHDYKIMPKDLEWTDPPNEWIHGTTGVGKSFKARKENPNAFLKQPNKWWDRYSGEDSVIIEDLGMTHSYLGDHLKIWADKYSFPVEIKGSGDRIRPKKIIITSNYAITDIWKDPNIYLPLMRRFKVIHITKAWDATDNNNQCIVCEKDLCECEKSV